MLKRLLGTFVAILFFSVICSAQSLVYLPQFVDGLQGGFTYWASIVAVNNPAAPGTPAASGTVTVTANDGSPWNLTFFDETGVTTTNTFQLAGGQTKLFFSPTAGGSGIPPAFNYGFATVSSNIAVTAGLVFVEGDFTNGITSQAGVQAVTPQTKQATIAVKNSTENTGVAIANPGSGTATVTFQLLDKSGSLLVPAVTRTISGNNQSAFFITELFTTITTSVTGTLKITSDKGVAVLALLIAQPKGLLASIPTFPVN